jgi:hypothetical protein
MVAFRNGLAAAEKAPGDAQAWSPLGGLLIELSTTFAREAESDPRRTAREADTPG